ncbi:LOW QUALITY PROTEIN: leukocyte elastase inhibitor-like [Synchiropus picturatus]
MTTNSVSRAVRATEELLAYVCLRHAQTPPASHLHLSTDNMASRSPLSKASTTFCLNLLKKLCDDGEADNLVVSPFSIFSSLFMLLLGAKGNTREQIAEVMELLISPGDFLQSFGELQRKILSKDAPYSLNIANRLYGEQTSRFLEKFLKDCETDLGAKLEPVDFINQAEKARVSINHWVEVETEGKIKDLLGSGLVDNSTKLIVVNAIYFKSDWASQFPKEATTDGKFWISKTEWKPVKMMHLSGDFRYAAFPDYNCKVMEILEVLELPYKRGELSMIVVLPDDIGDGPAALNRLMGSLLCDNINKWMDCDTMATTPVKVSLPCFSIEDKIPLKDVLKELGMVDAFDPTISDFSGASPVQYIQHTWPKDGVSNPSALFSGMSLCDNMAVSGVIHQASIDVNEEGTEAAAATAGMLVGGSRRTKWESFVADHLFFFLIIHKRSSIILFAGGFNSPQ